MLHIKNFNFHGMMVHTPINSLVFSLLSLAFCFLSFFGEAKLVSAKPNTNNYVSQSSPKTYHDANTPNILIHSSESITEQQMSQTDESVSANLPATIAQESQKANLTNTLKSNREMARQLWQSRTRFPPKKDDTKYKDELQYLIELIRSVKFESPSHVPEPIITIKPIKSDEPKKSTPIIEKSPEPFEQKSEPKIYKSLSYKSVTNKTLQTLQNLSPDPEQLYNHLELAEILFLSDHKNQAVKFYQQAIDHIDNEDPASAQDKAWILFQIANCLKDEDLLKAKKVYRQLITESPNSLWTELAKAEEKLIDWYLKDKPQALIDEKGL